MKSKYLLKILNSYFDLITEFEIFSLKFGFYLVLIKKKNFLYFFLNIYSSLIIILSKKSNILDTTNSNYYSYVSIDNKQNIIMKYYMIVDYYNSFYNLKPNLNLQSNCISSRIENQNINMNFCLISIISSNNQGGAIYISTLLSLNINDTTFYQCISTESGGAIYFENGLNTQLFRICAICCNSGDREFYQFAYLQTTFNQILDLITIYNCTNLNGEYTLTLDYGNQNMSNINISYNNNRQTSSIWYRYPYSMFSDYCTFYNNSAISHNCIWLVGNTGTISKSNIILNNSPKSYGVVQVSYSGNYILKECIFDQNQNTLLSVNEGSLQIINCYYLTGSSSTYGSISNTLLIKQTNTFLITHYMN